MAANKERLDVALVRRGLAPSHERARALIMAGQVYVGDRMLDKPGMLIPLDADCLLAHAPAELKYVNRGGLKLEKALATFQLSPAGLGAIDVSFISLRLVLPAIIPLLAPEAWIVALVKPQFEAGKAEADKVSGVSTDPAVHTRVLEELQDWIQKNTPFKVRGLTDSPILGRDGNREFLLYLGL